MVGIINREKLNIKILIVIAVISAFLTVCTAVLFGKNMFVHHGVKTYSDWSKCQSGGYAISGNHVISTEGDPYIYFTCDEKVEQVEVDVQVISSMEMYWNNERFGENVIYGKLYWTNEAGELSEENSVPFKVKAGRDSYLLNVNCPANTLYRLDIGDGVDVEFKAYALSFNTYNEYTRREKIKSLAIMFIMLFAVIVFGYISNVKAKEETNN